MDKGIVIINENHEILPEQEEILNKCFEGKENWNFLKAPKSGWTYEEQCEIINEIIFRANEAQKHWDKTSNQSCLNVIFCSPIPAMLMILSRIQGRGGKFEVHVFHNDNREAKELPNGKIIHVIAKTGWMLI